MKSLAALLHRKAIDSSVETNRSTSPLASPGAGSVPDAERAASVRPSGGARKTRLGALSGLVDRFSSLRRERSAARSGAGGADPTVVRQLEQRLRHHPELKPARLARYRAELGLDGADGIGALTADSLARMPPKLAGQIAAIRHAGVVGPRTIDAVWDALATNLELYESPLRAIGTAAARPVAPTARHADLDDGRRVIATSTPAAVEVAAFHRTLVQEKVALVVDLTRGARSERHVPYAPAKAETVQRATGSTIDVACKSRGKLPPLGVVQQQLRVHDVAAPVMADTFATSTVTRLHFKGWPAHGPIDGKTLVEVDSPEPFFAASLAAGKLG